MSRPAAALVLAVAALAGAAAPAQAAPRCAPFAPPRFAGNVPTPRSVLGIDLGKRDVTVAESDRYLLAVDAASERVTSGVLARIPCRAGRCATRSSAVPGAHARRPRSHPLGRGAAAGSVHAGARGGAHRRRDPAILWIAGNVHGGEESGTDASLRVLYELADRRDCAARQIRDEALVVILPTQNPDGREADTPAATTTASTSTATGSPAPSPRPTASSKRCAGCPPVVFVDAHEMGGADDTSSRRTPTRSTTRSPTRRSSWINDALRPGDAARVRRAAGFRTSTIDLRPLLHGLRRHGAVRPRSAPPA